MSRLASAHATAQTPQAVLPAGPGQPWPNRVAGQASVVVSLVMAGTGVAMIGLALATDVASTRKAIEVLLGVAVVVSGALLARSRMKAAADVSAGLLPGEITLAAALVYLGVAMPAFQHGAARSQAVGQFVAVVVALVVGCAGLVYSRAPVGHTGKPSLAVMVRDGVLLITGTIVVAWRRARSPTRRSSPEMELGQLPRPDRARNAGADRPGGCARRLPPPSSSVAELAWPRPASSRRSSWLAWAS